MILGRSKAIEAALHKIKTNEERERTLYSDLQLRRCVIGRRRHREPLSLSNQSSAFTKKARIGTRAREEETREVDTSYGRAGSYVHTRTAFVEVFPLRLMPQPTLV